VDSENIVIETAERIFADLADSQTIINAKNDDWKVPVWQAVEGAGLTLTWVPEAQGGAGAGVDDGFGVLRAAGRAALSVPLAETMLAGWLLAQGGISSPSGTMSVAPAHPHDHITIDKSGLLNGVARKVPFARDVAHLAVVAEGSDGEKIALVDAKSCQILHGENLAGEATDTVKFAGVKPLSVKNAPAGFATNSLLLMGAAVRAQQIAGALETMLAISVRYSTERIAFEKQISKFQAVQHNLARLGGETAAAVAAACSAADTVAAGSLSDAVGMLEIAAAKIRCSEAAESGAGIAHQVHGAIGFTDEHVLHRLTLRALAWRDDFGNESYWSVKLGEFVASRGADELWPLVASR
jgi:acyl-CoA dehydrogenase